MKSLFIEMGGTYRQEGDYLIPNLTLPNDGDYEIGKYEHLRLAYLKEHRKILYTNYVTEGTLSKPGTEPGTESDTEPGTDIPGEPDDPDKKDGLGAGAIVGIVIGSVAVVGVGGFALFWFVIKKKTWADFLAIFKKK